MKDQEIILRVQAFVDGQLPESEQDEIAALIARDADVHALVKELKQTRQALAGFDETMELPEDPEFYWSKIERAIEQFPQDEEQSPAFSPLSLILRWMVPATCVALLVAAGFLVSRHPWAVGDEMAWQSVDDSVSAFTYQDYDEGMTVLWLSYPADNAVADPEETAIIN
jgi:anti-sigma factor RsiW